MLPNTPDGDGIYSLTMEGAGLLEDSIAKELMYAVDIFVQAGRRGAYPPSHVAPLGSAIRQINPVGRAAEALVWDLSLQRVDLSSFEAIRNMAMQIDERSVIRQISVDDSSKVHATYSKPEPNEENEFESYPAVSSRVPFTMRAEEGEVGKMRRFVVSLSVAVEAAHIAQIRDWITPWYDMLEMGAFARPVGWPNEVRSFRDDVTLFDERSVEITVRRYQASETGWHVLLNMLGTCWGTGTVISEVLID